MSVTSRRQISQFVLVGGCGFLVDAVLLQSLVWAGLDPVPARLASFPVAVVTTWLMHRRLTFADRRASRRGLELGKYLMAQIVSALLGLAAFTWLVLYTDFFARVPLAALVVSSAIGTVSNYLLSHYVVFTGERAG
ncbi:MAG: GtrA family protein [Pseudomonadota bacterium]